MEEKTLWYKEKMLATCIYPFSNIDIKNFLSQGLQHLGRSGKGLNGPSVISWRKPTYLLPITRTFSSSPNALNLDDSKIGYLVKSDSKAIKISP